MPKSLDPKCKKCRREGVKLFLKGEKCSTAKCPIIRRNYPPGAHGTKRKGRLTEYGTQLREKQKAKRIYGIFERQFRNYYEKAVNQTGDSQENLRRLLEMRFDNVVYRMGFAKSRTQARQMVGHGMFFVNNKKVNIPSYQMKPKDQISINEHKIKSKNFVDLEKSLETKDTISWIHVDPKNLSAKILNAPKGDELQQTFNPRLIIEFYSK
ncbi:MAG: 30S ribosomal protein S4 [Candidatus Buchananbacteria bacterium]